MSDRTGRRAARIARLYPRQWRRQYPDFVEALTAELAEHRRGVRADALRGATIERLRAAGLLPAGSADRARSGLALVYAPLLPFVGLSAGMWSQLRTATTGAGSAVPVLGGDDLLLAVGTTLALVSLAVGVLLVAAQARRRRVDTVKESTCGRLVAPALALTAALAALTGGGWAADRSGWYSPAAAGLPNGGVGHLLTLWIRGMIAAVTPAWIHPSLFGHMPTGDLIATLVAPLAASAAGVALLRLIVRLPVPPPGRSQLAVAATSVGAMFLSAGATARWLLARPHQESPTHLLVAPGQLAPGHTPWAVAVVLGALALIAAIGIRRLRHGGQKPPDSGDRRAVNASSWRPQDDQPTPGGSFDPIIDKR